VDVKIAPLRSFHTVRTSAVDLIALVPELAKAGRHKLRVQSQAASRGTVLSPEAAFALVGGEGDARSSVYVLPQEGSVAAWRVEPLVAAPVKP
jgi:hypothetical protein